MPTEAAKKLQEAVKRMKEMQEAARKLAEELREKKEAGGE